MGTLQIVVIAVMVLLNAIFAAFELALASVGVHRLEQLAAEHRRGAKAALRMKGRMEASLAVVQLGITFVGATAAAVGGAGADESLSPWLQARWGLGEVPADFLSLIIIVVPLSAITIVIGELVPKSFAIRHAEWVSVRLSPAMQVFSMAVYPVVVGFETLTKVFVDLVERLLHGKPTLPPTGPDMYRAGMKELLVDARALRLKRRISPEQERVIVGAGRLAEMTVGEIMIPAREIKMLYADGRLTEHLITVHLEAHTRFLVTETPGDPQGIIGYVNVKDLFFLAKTHPENPSVREIIRPLIRLAPGLRLNEALARMLTEHLHLALVKDDAGKVMGMITMEDILEEVVGDIQDEFDRLPKSLIPAGRQWIVGGGVTIGRLREATGKPQLADGASPTMSFSDWAASHGLNMQAGEVIELDGLRILVRKVRRQKLVEALVQPAQASVAMEPQARAVGPT